jgi:NAD(P)-dependent dehydrogenase (short-subunit alcohol dehydrogenase family)
MNRLKGKTALITGAARGLGAAIARRFAEEGATVLINDLNLDAARRTATSLNGSAFAANVADSTSVANMFADIAEAAPRLDILVNNAGISGLEGRDDNGERLSRIVQRALAASRGEAAEPDNGTMETTDDEWHKMMARWRTRLPIATFGSTASRRAGS